MSLCEAPNERRPWPDLEAPCELTGEGKEKGKERRGRGRGLGGAHGGGLQGRHGGAASVFCSWGLSVAVLCVMEKGNRERKEKERRKKEKRKRKRRKRK
jgi:hypothetical protein